MFNVPVGIPCWVLGEHEPLIIALFITVFSRGNQKLPWTINQIYWAYLTARYVDLECKRGQEHPGPVQMEGKLCQVSEEASESSEDILLIFLHRSWAIPSMSDDVV